MSIVTATSSAPVRASADLDTIERARSGDSDALAQLWAIYQPQILRLLRSRGGTAAEDVASQVWIEVERRIDRFEGDGDAFRGWVFTLAGRRSIDEARRVSRRLAAQERSSASASAAESVDELVDRSFESARELLAPLQDDVAEVVMLRVVHDLPVSEVARITGRTENHVRVTTHRALASLRDAVAAGRLGVSAAPV